MKDEPAEGQLDIMIRSIEGYRDQALAPVIAHWQARIDEAVQRGWPKEAVQQVHSRMQIDIDRVARPYVEELVRLYQMKPIRITVELPRVAIADL